MHSVLDRVQHEEVELKITAGSLVVTRGYNFSLNFVSPQCVCACGRGGYVMIGMSIDGFARVDYNRIILFVNT